MPDTEISRLEELPASGVVAEDVLAIVDHSQSETKKIKALGLVQKAVDEIGDGSISIDKIDWNTNVDPGVINGSALVNRSIPAVKLVENTLTAAEIAPNAIGTSELADGAVDEAALQNLAVTNGKLAGGIAGSKLLNDTITANQIAPNAIGSSELADGAVDTKSLQVNAVTADKLAQDLNGDAILGNGTIDAALAANSVGSTELADNAVGTSHVKTNAITNDKLANDAVDGTNIADDSISAVHLKSDAVTTVKIKDGAVTNAKITGVSGTKIDDNSILNSKLGPGIDGSKLLDDTVSDSKLLTGIDGAKIKSNSISNGQLQTGISGSKLVDLSVSADKLSGGISGAKLSDNTVPNSKLQNGIDGSKITADSINDSQLQDGINGGKIQDISITADKLGPSSVTSAKIADGAVVDSKIGDNLNGRKISAGSIQPLSMSPTGFSNGIELDGTIKLINTITPGSRNGIVYNEQGLITGTTQIPSTDVPVATATSIGGVSVPGNGGLSVTLNGALSISTNIVAGTTSGISYSNHGLITSTRPLTGDDLPPSTSTTIGAVAVPTNNNNPLTVDGLGNLTHTAGVSPGKYVNVNVNQYGLVQSGDVNLESSQVPGLDASKIVSGTFGTARIADDAITMQKISDYAVSFIQEAQPTLNNDILHIGCFWFQESTGQLRCFNGNSWNNVGFGRLSQDNLRFGGLVDADTGLIANLTDAGRTAGLKIGDAVLDPTDSLGGLYLVVSVPGSGINVDNVKGLAFDAGDWCLCINGQADGGWVRIDTLNGGGGSGGAQKLNDLIDVDINNVQIGDTLIYSSNGLWTNRTTTADRVTITPEFDGSTTSFNTSIPIIDQNNVLMSVAGVLMEPQKDFNIASGTTQLNFTEPPPEGSTYFLINQQTVNTSSSGGGGSGWSPPAGNNQNPYMMFNSTLDAWVASNELDGGVY